MDPTANLKAQAELLATPGKWTRADYLRLIELSEALYDWLAQGGFEPDWEKYPQTTKAYRDWAVKHAKKPQRRHR